jgi:hypothetical protein
MQAQQIPYMLANAKHTYVSSDFGQHNSPQYDASMFVYMPCPPIQVAADIENVCHAKIVR